VKEGKGPGREKDLYPAGQGNALKNDRRTKKQETRHPLGREGEELPISHSNRPLIYTKKDTRGVHVKGVKVEKAPPRERGGRLSSPGKQHF